ncbi:MAG: serine/threonine-protein kinase [Pseudomonadota bacterium]
MTASSRDMERKALDLLEDALAKPSPQRAAWIEAQADVEDAVRLRTLSLLNAQKTRSNELETGGAAKLVKDIPPPERVGPYRIGDRLGRGGMGAVYLAERDSGDFAHKTAVKFIRQGLLSDSLIERFRRERQLLASLKHPNIAQLYDGGETDDGTPYIIMEYVDGAPLPQWLEAKPRPLEDRLMLFLQICAAVEFAHQNLIIHRDLTPSNVLVTTEGQAKLIDFGIAKPPTVEAADLGRSSLSKLSLTPGFAAPERAHSAAANTLTDIYSLGQVLKSLAGPARNPELLAIAEKASATEPAARYGTARTMAKDVEHYLAGLPVSAYSTSTRYRLGKFVRRQRLPLAAATIALIALIGGLVGVSIAYQRAEQARANAAARFEDVRALAKFQLFELYDTMSRVAGNTQARGDLAEEAQGYLATLASDPAAAPDVKLDTAAGYVRLARIMGVPSRPSLGEPDAAAAHLAAAGQILDALAAPAPLPAPLQERYIAITARLLSARALIGIHEDMTMDKARADLDAAAATLAEMPDSSRGAQWHAASRLVTHAESEYGDMSSNAAHIREAAAKLRTNARSLPETLLPPLDAEFDEALAFYLDGIASYVEGAHDDAVASLAQADAAFTVLDQKRFNDPVVLYMQAWNNYIGYGSAAQRTDLDLERKFIDRAQAVTDRLKTLEERDAMVASMDSRLKEARAQFLAKTGDLAGAITVQQDILAHYRSQMAKAQGRRHVFNVTYSQIVLAFLMRDAGDLDGACEELRQANAMLAPIHAKQTLPSFMARAADETPKRIALCENGQDIGPQSTMFEEEGWSPNDAGAAQIQNQ